jgi:tetratricopeptide (TPR) repeat protein
VCVLAVTGLVAEPDPVDSPAPASMADMAMGGEDGPFYPSALHTEGGGTLPVAETAAASSCGGAGCHQDIVDQWSSSPHRYSGAENPWYLDVLHRMEAEVSVEATRWCAGCHTPSLLAAGRQEVAEAAGTAAAGVSCTSCHRISRVGGTLGQAHFELARSSAFELGAALDPLARAMARASILADPSRHRQTFAPAHLATSELCSTCHNAFADTPVGGDGWVSVMNDYDSWQASSSSGQAITQSIYEPAPRECAGCHMPRVASSDPAAIDGTVLSHRFAAANTALPALHGDEEQMRAVIDFLTDDKVTVDLFALVEDEGPGERVHAPLDLAPAVLRRGSDVRVDVVIRNRGVGHAFPGGKNISKDCWLELVAEDGSGRVLYRSGEADEGRPTDPEAHPVSSAWLDADGELVEHYEVWREFAPVYLRRLDPSTAQTVGYRFRVPGDAEDPVRLTARLHYRKIAPGHTARVFEGSEPPVRVPIVTLDEATTVLAVSDDGAEPPGAEPPGELDEETLERWNDYAYGFAIGGDFSDSREAYGPLLERAPGYSDGWVTLGNLQWILGQRDEARKSLRRGLDGDPGLVRAHFYLGLVERDDGNFDAAVEHFRAVTESYPREALAWRFLAGVLTTRGENEEARRALERSLAVGPTDSAVHFMMAQVLRSLGDPEGAARHQELYSYYRADLDRGRLALEALEQRPHLLREREGGHVHGRPPEEEPEGESE